MIFLLIFPVLVTGFLACHIHPVHSYKLHRYEGQYLYLKSAELGLICFFWGFIAWLALHYLLPDSVALCGFSVSLGLSDWLAGVMGTMIGISDPARSAELKAEAVRMASFFELSALTFAAAYLVKLWGHVSLLARFGSWSARVYVIGRLLEDSPLDNLLFQMSLQRDKSVMIAMEDRKVYVGKIISLGEPSATTGMDQDIAIMPLMSGYRDKDTLKVTFTTFYEEVAADIAISLRQDNIVSATEFDFGAYRIWNPASANGDTHMAAGSGRGWFGKFAGLFGRRSE